MSGKAAVKKDRSKMFFIVFFSLFGFCIIGSLVMAIITDGASFGETLFFAERESLNKDFFMDFFNSMRDASTMQVYDRGVIYPPLANLLFLLFAKMISPSLAGSTFNLRYSMQLNQQCIILYLFFAAACIVAFSFMIQAYLSKKNSIAAAHVFSFSIIFMYPFYYCIERGNIVLLSMILSAFFVFFHDSESKIVRELSYIMLALAAGLKIYPAFYGLILLQEKRYKAALKTVVYGVVCFFVPFLFYNHGASLFQFIENIMRFSSQNKAVFSFGSVGIMNLFYFLGDKYVPLGKAVFLLSEVLAAIFVFFAPKKWQKYLLLSYMIININSVASTYAEVFFMIPFFMFMSKDSKKVQSDWIYLILFALLLLPLPCFYFNHPETMDRFFNAIHLASNTMVNKLVAWPVVQFMYFLVCVESLTAMIDAKKSGKKLSSFFYKKSTKSAKAKTGKKVGAAEKAAAQ